MVDPAEAAKAGIIAALTTYPDIKCYLDSSAYRVFSVQLYYQNDIKMLSYAI